MNRRRASDELVIGKIEDSNPRKPANPSIRAGIPGDVDSGGSLEKSDAVAEIDGTNPPADVIKESFV